MADDLFEQPDNATPVRPEKVAALRVAVADRLRAKFRKLSELMDGAENEVLAYMAFPKSHWSQIHSTNPIERLNREIKRRTNVVSIFPNEAAIVRLIGAILLEQNDE